MVLFTVIVSSMAAFLAVSHPDIILVVQAVSAATLAAVLSMVPALSVVFLVLGIAFAWLASEYTGLHRGCRVSVDTWMGKPPSLGDRFWCALLNRPLWVQ